MIVQLRALYPKLAGVGAGSKSLLSDHLTRYVPTPEMPVHETLTLDDVTSEMVGAAGAGFNVAACAGTAARMLTVTNPAINAAACLNPRDPYIPRE